MAKKKTAKKKPTRKGLNTSDQEAMRKYYEQLAEWKMQEARERDGMKASPPNAREGSNKSKIPDGKFEY